MQVVLVLNNLKIDLNYLSISLSKCDTKIVILFLLSKQFTKKILIFQIKIIF